jgi:hypothetical protein
MHHASCMMYGQDMRCRALPQVCAECVAGAAAYSWHLQMVALVCSCHWPGSPVACMLTGLERWLASPAAAMQCAVRRPAGTVKHARSHDCMFDASPSHTQLPPAHHRATFASPVASPPLPHVPATTLLNAQASSLPAGTVPITSRQQLIGLGTPAANSSAPARPPPGSPAPRQTQPQVELLKQPSPAPSQQRSPPSSASISTGPAIGSGTGSGAAAGTLLAASPGIGDVVISAVPAGAVAGRRLAQQAAGGAAVNSFNLAVSMHTLITSLHTLRAYC